MFSWKPKPSEVKRLATLEEEVAEINRLLAKADDQMKLLQQAHAKLSGRYYRRFGTEEYPSKASDNKTLTKAQLKAKLGIIPGRPLPTQLDIED